MTKKLLIIIALLALTLSACTINGYGITINTERLEGSGNIISESRSVSGFERVDLKSIGNLTIVQGGKESLSIKADDNILPYITTEVIGGTLEIGMKPNWSVNPTQAIEYELVVKDLSSVTLSGFGNINAVALEGTDLQIKLSGSGDINLGVVKSDSLNVRLSGFGNITVNEMVVSNPELELTGSGDLVVDQMSAEALLVKISGFGNAKFAGKADSQDVRITGSGDYLAPDLESNIATIQISGFGNAKVWAKSDLTIKITGSGSLEYYGNPEISQTMTGLGKVNSLGDHK